MSPNDRGTFTVKVRVSDATDRSKFNEYSFKVIVLVLTPPYFKQELQDVTMRYDFSFKQMGFETIKVRLPHIFVDEEVPATLRAVYFDPGKKYDFIRFHNTSGESLLNYTIEFDPNKVTERVLRFSPIKLEVIIEDSNNMVSKHFLLIIIEQQPKIKQPWMQSQPDNGFDFKQPTPEIKRNEANGNNKPELVQARIEEISASSVVKIKFDKQVELIWTDQIVNNSNASSGRRLSHSLDFLDNDIIRISVLPSEENPYPPTVSWRPVDFEPQTSQLKLQLQFNDTLSVSSHDFNKIKIEFLKPEVFRSTQSAQVILGQLQIEQFINPQLQPTELMTLTAFTLFWRIYGFVILLLFITSLLTCSLRARSLTTSIKPLQLVFLHAMIAYPYPAIVNQFLSAKKEVAFFNLIPEVGYQIIGAESEYQQVLQLSINPAHKAIGLKNHELMINIGCLILILALICLAFIILIMESVISTIFKCRFRLISTSLVWHSLSHFTLSAFVPIGVSVYLHFRANSQSIDSILHQYPEMFFGFCSLSKPDNSIENLLVLISVCCLSLYLLVGLVTAVAFSNNVMKTKSNFLRVFGFYCQDLRVHSRQRAYWLVFVVRRLVLIAVAFYLTNEGILQLLIAVVMAYLKLAYLGFVRPLSSPSRNRTEFVNETLVTFILHVHFWLSDKRIKPHDLNSIGWVYIGLILILALFNLQLIAREIIWRLYLLGLKYYIRLYFKLTGLRLNRYLKEISEEADQSMARIRRESDTLRLGLQQDNKQHKFGRFQLMNDLDVEESQMLSVIEEISEITSFRSQLPDTGDEQLDRLLKEAQNLLGDQVLTGKKKNELQLMKEELINKIARYQKKEKLEDDFDLIKEVENLLLQTREMLAGKDLIIIRNKEIEQQNQDLIRLMEQRRKRQLNDQRHDHEDEKAVLNMLNNARKVLDNKQIGIISQFKSAIDLIAQRKRQLSELNKPNKELEAFLEKARVLLNDETVVRLKRNDQNKLLEELMDKIHRAIQNGNENGLQNLIKDANQLFAGIHFSNNQYQQQINQQESIFQNLIGFQKKEGLANDEEDPMADIENEINDLMAQAKGLMKDSNKALIRNNELERQQQDLLSRLERRRSRKHRALNEEQEEKASIHRLLDSAQKLLLSTCIPIDLSQLTELLEQIEIKQKQTVETGNDDPELAKMVLRAKQILNNEINFKDDGQGILCRIKKLVPPNQEELIRSVEQGSNLISKQKEGIDSQLDAITKKLNLIEQIMKQKTKNVDEFDKDFENLIYQAKQLIKQIHHADLLNIDPHLSQLLSEVKRAHADGDEDTLNSVMQQLQGLQREKTEVNSAHNKLGEVLQQIDDILLKAKNEEIVNTTAEIEDVQLEEMVKQANILIQDQTLSIIRKQELEQQQEKLLAKIRSRQSHNNKDSSDEQQIILLIEKAKERVKIQEFHNEKIHSSHQKLNQVVEQIIKRKMQLGKDETDSVLEDLVKQARDIMEEDSWQNLKMNEVSMKNMTVFENLKKRYRDRNGLALDQEDENNKELAILMREFQEMADDGTQLLERQKEKLEQEKVLNQRLQERNRRRKTQKRLNLFEALRNVNSSSENQEIEEFLDKALEMINDQECLNNKMQIINKKQRQLAAQIEKRKNHRQDDQEAKKNADENNGRELLKEIDEMLKQAGKLLLDQSMTQSKQQEIEKQQAQLLERLTQRITRGSVKIDTKQDLATDDTAAFDNLLQLANKMNQEKMKLRLILDEKQHYQTEKLKSIQERKQAFQQRLGQPQDIDQFMQEAKRLIGDQQMVAQQKLEIGLQQDDLIAKLAKRRGQRAAAKMTEAEEKKRKQQLLDPKYGIERKPVDQENLDELIQRAKEIIRDQNLITLMQIDIGQQQSSLNTKLEQNKQQQKDLSEILKKIQKLTTDQNMLNLKQKQYDEEQQQVLSNLKREALNEEKGEGKSLQLLLKEAEQLLHIQNTLTNKKLEADYQMTNKVIDQKSQNTQGNDKITAKLKQISINKTKYQEDFEELLFQSRKVIEDNRLKQLRELEIQSQKNELLIKQSARSHRRLQNLTNQTLDFLKHQQKQDQESSEEIEVEEIVDDMQKHMQTQIMQGIINHQNKQELETIRNDDISVEGVADLFVQQQQVEELSEISEMNNTMSGLFHKQKMSVDPRPSNNQIVSISPQDMSKLSTQQFFYKPVSAFNINGPTHDMQNKSNKQVINILGIKLKQKMDEEFEQQQKQKLSLAEKQHLMKNKKLNTKFI